GRPPPPRARGRRPATRPARPGRGRSCARLRAGVGRRLHRKVRSTRTAEKGSGGMGALDIQWLMLPGQRPWRELHWLSLMPEARVTAVGDPRPPEAVEFVRRPYRRPTDRFVEGGGGGRRRGAVRAGPKRPRPPLYRLPPYRQALRRARSAELYLCLVEAARDHC